MSANNKPLRVIHVDDDHLARSLIEMIVKSTNGEYIPAEDLEEFQKKVNDNLKDFDSYRNVFISDGQFPANKDNSEAYLEVIEFLEKKIDKKYLKLIIISGEPSIVEDANNLGYIGFSKGTSFITQLKALLESE